MRAVSLLLSYWAFTNDGRRVHINSRRGREVGGQQLSPCRVLLIDIPASAWQVGAWDCSAASKARNDKCSRWRCLPVVASEEASVAEKPRVAASSRETSKVELAAVCQSPEKSHLLQRTSQLCNPSANNAAKGSERRSVWSFIARVCKRLFRHRDEVTKKLASSVARNIASHGEASVTMISFYRFLHVSEPGKVADEFRATIQNLDASIRGTLYVAEEGINGAFMVPTSRLQEFHSALGFVRGMRGKLADLDFNIGECMSAEDIASNPPFRKLLIKSRPQILTDGLARNMDQASMDWNDAGPEVSPEQWHQEVEKDVAEDRAILIDCRNRVETEMGTFKGAKALNTQQFSDSWEKLDKVLHGVEKDTRILTFCTGGIRCVKVNAYLKNRGYENIGRLEKGIIGYENWLGNHESSLQSTFEGKNFLFDRRRTAPSMTESATLVQLEAPPVLNSPVYSLATLCDDGRTDMNILTYATPVGISPRLWAISLFRKTLSHANFKREGTAVLQLLCDPHTSLVYTLGGQSGRDVDKALACAEAGCAWLRAPDQGKELLLPGCAAYLRLHQVGELLDAGEHDVALCRVEAFADPRGPPPDAALSTAALRAAGLITDKGRAVEPAD